MKYFLVAGEASGDLHGANLMKALKDADPEAEFAFWGGDKMAAISGALLKHYKEITLMGFVEVLVNIRRVFANLAQCKQDILAFQPDVTILIDYPGFNLRIAEFCKKNGIRTTYFIAPKVWAWKENRAKKLEQFVDDLLLILPFEAAYFRKWKVNAHYVGNPLQDEISAFKPDPAFLSSDTRPLIALLPGSRKQEIERMLPVMIEAVKELSSYRFIVAGAPGIDASFYEPYFNQDTVVVFNETYNILANADLAIVCSGTATLETALFHVPQVCCYAGNPISFFIAKLLVKVKFISLVNLCMDRAVIPELIQHDFNVDQLRSALMKLAKGTPQRSKMEEDYRELSKLIGGKGASKNAAEIIYHQLRNR